MLPPCAVHKARWFSARPSLMAVDSELLTPFKEQLKRSREADQDGWDGSRRLVAQPTVRSTLKRLAEAIQAASLHPVLRDALLAAIREGSADRIQDLPAELLKQLTGLPATKAVRALCVLFGLTVSEAPTFPVSSFKAAHIEQFVRNHDNPYDLLLSADIASLLDLGAGDLSFAAELSAYYLPRLQPQRKSLILHCLDRLQPGSHLGGPLHADSVLLQKLQQLSASPSYGLQFRFWGNQDMFALEAVKGIWPRYTIVTCHAPATPTFAYEPTRISASKIEQHLRQTKGAFRKTRVKGEEALEVLHKGRVLLFPPWKFDIKGPLALLDLLSQRGKLCVLGSVDTQVFWELLSQLLADERVRPRDVILSPANIPDLFGPIYTKLSSLPVGASVALSDLAEIRPAIPHVLPGRGATNSPYRFRYVEIRRGAVFDEIPSSRTARLFKDMTEEEVPWFLILVPDDASSTA